MMQDKQARWLRIAFLAGALTDAVAVMPMLSSALARLLWGFDESSSPCRFAMGYGSSLMIGWTTLCAWAYRNPIETRFVAVLTIVVILGLAATQLVAVPSGDVPVARVAPTWGLQAVLVTLFVIGAHYPALRRRSRSNP